MTKSNNTKSKRHNKISDKLTHIHQTSLDYSDNNNTSNTDQKTGYYDFSCECCGQELVCTKKVERRGAFVETFFRYFLRESLVPIRCCPTCGKLLVTDKTQEEIQCEFFEATKIYQMEHAGVSLDTTQLERALLAENFLELTNGSKIFFDKGMQDWVKYEIPSANGGKTTIGTLTFEDRCILDLLFDAYAEEKRKQGQEETDRFKEESLLRESVLREAALKETALYRANAKDIPLSDMPLDLQQAFAEKRAELAGLAAHAGSDAGKKAYQEAAAALNSLNPHVTVHVTAAATTTTRYHAAPEDNLTISPEHMENSVKNAENTAKSPAMAHWRGQVKAAQENFLASIDDDDMQMQTLEKKAKNRRDDTAPEKPHNRTFQEVVALFDEETQSFRGCATYGLKLKQHS